MMEEYQTQIMISFILFFGWGFFGFFYAIGFVVARAIFDKPRPWAGFKHYFVGLFLSLVVSVLLLWPYVFS